MDNTTREKFSIIEPIVNLNGTSRRELIEQHMNAGEALYNALKALQVAAPQGRRLKCQ